MHPPHPPGSASARSDNNISYHYTNQRFGFSMMWDKFCHSCFEITAHFTSKTKVRFQKGGSTPTPWVRHCARGLQQNQTNKRVIEQCGFKKIILKYNRSIAAVANGIDICTKGLGYDFPADQIGHSVSPLLRRFVGTVLPTR